MESEIEAGLEVLRNSLLKCAEVAQAMANSEKPDGDETPEAAEEFKKSMVEQVIKLMDLESEALKVAEVYKKLRQEENNEEKVKDEDDHDYGTMEKMNKKWEKMSKEAGEVKGGYRKRFKEIAKEIQNEENGEEAVEMMQAFCYRKDPIMKKDIEKPVRTKACGHVYDRDSLVDYVGTKKYIPCVIQGCTAKVYISKLEDFPEYFNLIRDD